MNISITVSEELGTELGQMAAKSLTDNGGNPIGLTSSELIKTLILDVFRPRLTQYRQSLASTEHDISIQEAYTAKDTAITNAIQTVGPDLDTIEVAVE